MSRKNLFSDKKIGKRIKSVRQSKGLLQKEFVEPLGIKQAHLSSIEKGERAPSKTLFILMCLIYSINRKWLDTGEGEMFESDQSLDAILGKPSHIDSELLSNIIDVALEYLKKIKNNPKGMGKLVTVTYNSFVKNKWETDIDSVREKIYVALDIFSKGGLE